MNLMNQFLFSMNLIDVFHFDEFNLNLVTGCFAFNEFTYSRVLFYCIFVRISL